MLLRRSFAGVPKQPLLFLGLLLFLGACGKVGAPPAPPAPSAASAPHEALGITTGPTIPPGAPLPDFTVLVEKTAPAVVNISTSQKVRVHDMEDFGEDPFGDFFKRFGPPNGAGKTPDLEAKSLGSGFIITNTGFILTNAHVVANADEVEVRLTDKRTFKAKTIGIDRRTDVALLKIAAQDLPTVTIGDPTKLKVGEWVVAIGSPFGFDSTVTKGIVSAVGRSLPDENYTPFIQTDAAVNPGNSGGPLFNLRGEVVGINSQIYSRTGGFMGISFAIPIDLAISVSNQLKSKGKVTRGRLGIRLQDLTQELAQSFGLDRATGALVAQVEKGSPAEKAGLKEGDIILSFGGKSIDSSKDLPGLVGSTTPGTEVQLGIWRKRRSESLTVKVGELVGEESPPQDQGAVESRLGSLTNLSPDLAGRLGVSHGVVLQSPKGPASRAGMRANDIILAMNNEAVSDARSMAEMLAGIPSGKSIALLIQREGQMIYVAVKLD